MPAQLPPLRASNGPADLLGGIGLLFRAVGLILTTGRLLTLSIVSALVTGAVLLGLVVGCWPLASHLSDAWIGSGAGGISWRSVAGAVTTVGLYLAMVVTFGITLPSVLLSPLADPISEAAEAKLGSSPDEGFSVGGLVRGVSLSIRHSLSRLVLMVLGSLLLLPLNLIAGIGSVLYTVLSVTWAAWWVCAEYVSNPAARHRHGVRVVARAMHSRPFACLGLGLASYVLLWVPVVNCFLVPIAVVAGTLLYRQLEAAGAFRPGANLISPSGPGRPGGKTPGNVAPGRVVGLP